MQEKETPIGDLMKVEKKRQSKAVKLWQVLTVQRLGLGTRGQLHQALDGTGAVAGSGETFLNTIVLPEKY